MRCIRSPPKKDWVGPQANFHYQIRYPLWSLPVGGGPNLRYMLCLSYAVLRVCHQKLPVEVQRKTGPVYLEEYSQNGKDMKTNVQGLG